MIYGFFKGVVVAKITYNEPYVMLFDKKRKLESIIHRNGYDNVVLVPH
jgi:hypothetical protein